MKKRLISAIAVLFFLCSFLVGCGSKETGGMKDEPKQSTESEKNEVKQLVTDFGHTLQKVSLLDQEDSVKKSIQENYGDFVSDALLTKWISDPQNAPGRQTSSPWPDRIEIGSLKKLSKNEYEVKGAIYEATSDNPSAAKRPITLSIKNINNHWLIDDVTIGGYENNDITYQNKQFGFDFTLPSTWENYMIVSDKWEGLAMDGSQGEKVVETGPMILIRHPKWTATTPRQDIPIMVFTLEQWNSLQNEEFHIGAAPIGPTELGRNSKYVFALPARYNFAFPEGYEEVEKILQSNSLHPTEAIE